MTRMDFRHEHIGLQTRQQLPQDVTTLDTRLDQGLQTSLQLTSDMTRVDF